MLPVVSCWHTTLSAWCPSVWSVNCNLSVYQGLNFSASFVTLTGHPHSGIPGWSPTNRPVSTDLVEQCQLDCSHSWILNLKKLSLELSYSLVHLGLILDTTQSRVFLLKGKSAPRSRAYSPRATSVQCRHALICVSCKDNRYCWNYSAQAVC